MLASTVSSRYYPHQLLAAINHIS